MTTNAMALQNHDGCAAWLKSELARLGCDVFVTTAPPIIKTPYDQEPFICPHGTVFYAAPTSEQIAEWVRDGVE